ncbi:MAG: glycine zipper protein [Rhodospirillales bacterium]|nr:glycine zipper protein [Rhodospirillales bacterium]
MEFDMITNTSMTLRKAALAGILLLPMGVAGCAETVGAGAGAYAGNQFGKGSGKTAATAAGALGGAVVGHEITH